MSFKPKNIYGSIPTTTRGRAVLIGGDPKGENILYVTGNSVVIRNIKNPLITELYNDHGYPPTVARYSPSGFYIASADTTGTVRIWDTTQAEHLLKIELRPISGIINDLVWSEDSKRIAVVGEGKEKYGAVFFWDTGASVGEISGHSKAVMSVDMKPNRPYRLATGGEDFQVNWFEGPPFKYKSMRKDHTRFVNCVRFNPQGTLLVSVGQDKIGYFYDGKTGEKTHQLKEENGHQGGIYAASWNAEGNKLLTASGDKTAKVWDVETGSVISTHTFGNDVEDQQLGCIWQGSYLITLSLNGHLNYLDLNNPHKPHQVVLGHNKFITAMGYDKAHHHMYTGSYDAVVTKWTVDAWGTSSISGKGHTNQISRLKIVGDWLVSSGYDDSVRFASIQSGSFGDTKIGADGPVEDIAVSADASLVIAVSNKSVFVIRNRAIAHTFKPSYQPTAVGLSNDNSEVIVGGADNNLYVYSLGGSTLTEKKKLKDEHRGPITCIAFSPDGKRFASCDKNREILVWSTSSHEAEIRGWVFHTARVNSLAWSPDSVHIVSGGLDQNLIVWNVQKPSERVVVKNSHHLGVNSVLWLDNNTVASCGQDSTWKTWSFTF